MNLSHLHYFETLAETKNFQEAAQVESITQPTLSQAINGLEKELGCRLFIRKKGSVDLTEKGTQFYQYVSTSLRFLNTGIELTQNTTPLKKEIRMGSIYSAQSKEWSNLIYEFRKQTKQEVSFNISQAPTETLKAKLYSGSLDIAFLDESLSDADLGSLPCWTQELCLIVNKRHPIAKQNTVSLDDLKGHYLISYDLNEPLDKTLASLIDGKALQVGYRYKDEITLASIVLANPDVMALSCQSWLLKAYTDEVRFLSIEEAPKDFRQMYIVYRLSALQNEAVYEFLELAKELFLPSKF